jgi:ribonuclease P protein component
MQGRKRTVKRNFRLKQVADFKRVRRHGRSYAHPLVVLIALANDSDRVRVGVSAGRAVGGAVQRNRAKRLLRAAINPLLPQISPGFDLVLLAREPVLNEKSQPVQQALTELLEKANLFIHDR